MEPKPTTVKAYLEAIPEERKNSFDTLRDTILNTIPVGFEECISYGMIGYVVPHSSYANGYHCNPKLPLPFVSIACQKNFIALYHLAIYADAKLFKWFVDEYPKHCSGKLDMGKSCIRFKKAEDIPYKLIGELLKKLSVKDWIKYYEENIKPKAKK